VSSTCGNAPSVYIPCVSPRNHADCIGNYCDAILSGEIITPAPCWHSSGGSASKRNAGWLRVIRCDRLAKDQPAEITMFQISEV
jgi:hypothetical protein